MRKGIALQTVPKGLLIIIFVLSVVPMISSNVGTSGEKKGNESKGRYFFRQTCKTCHTKGAAGGEITPLSKTQAQWKSYFIASKHKKGAEPLAKVLGEEEIQHVSVYLVAHAADSLQPETCGK